LRNLMFSPSKDSSAANMETAFVGTLVECVGHEPVLAFVEQYKEEQAHSNNQFIGTWGLDPRRKIH